MAPFCLTYEGEEERWKGNLLTTPLVSIWVVGAGVVVVVVVVVVGAQTAFLE